MDREGSIRKIRLGRVELFARVGCYEDDRPGELFVTQSGESGTHVACLWDALGIVTSLALQYGVPLRSIVEHFRGMRAGDVCGVPSADEVAAATSAPDALARWMTQRWPEYATGASLTPPPSMLAAPTAPQDGTSAGGAVGAVEV
jgi:ribonucleoside-diphosphate reductase alpha chain